MYRKTEKMLALEQERGSPIEELLQSLWAELQSEQRVADAIGITRATLYVWRRSLGIVTRWVVE